MTTKNRKSAYLQAVTLIDPATGWIETHTLPQVFTTHVVICFVNTMIIKLVYIRYHK